jgi:pSer/pThr/pTyr-binding forkhead associated (FHA) protein
VLYDLGSRGGTFLNNMRITESVLRPGDVISLAGVQLVYMMDDSTTGRVTPSDTQVNLRRVDEDGSVDR